jgi:hypothetical protein
MRPAITIALFGLLLAGCNSDPHSIGKTVPVRGRVFLDGKPFAGKARVTFWPDAAKGNTGEHRPSGDVDEDGNYELSTLNAEGAPPGYYKVTVRVLSETQSAMIAESPLSRYEMPQTTPLSAEVGESSADGAYELKLGRRLATPR